MEFDSELVFKFSHEWGGGLSKLATEVYYYYCGFHIDDLIHMSDTLDFHTPVVRFHTPV